MMLAISYSLSLNCVLSSGARLTSRERCRPASRPSLRTIGGSSSNVSLRYGAIRFAGAAVASRPV